jgi:hypothetical protein
MVVPVFRLTLLSIGPGPALSMGRTAHSPI